jgi:hypothetical protein
MPKEIFVDHHTDRPYAMTVHTVIETPSFINAAKEAGMSDGTRMSIINAVADQPDLGMVLRETGGFRKFRFAAEGKGKSGSYRVVSFYTGPHYPVFLITVFAKGERDNLSKAERNALAGMAKRLTEAFERKAK